MRSSLKCQAGGITIMVALMLLALLTVTIFSASRNAIRQAIITATAREGAETRNIADTGISWSAYWIDPGNVPGADNPGAVQLVQEQNRLVETSELAGIWQEIVSDRYQDMKLKASPDEEKAFNLRIMRSGLIRSRGTSQNIVQANSVNEHLYPKLWTVRSDARYKIGGMDFMHSKEALISSLTQTR